MIYVRVADDTRGIARGWLAEISQTKKFLPYGCLSSRARTAVNNESTLQFGIYSRTISSRVGGEIMPSAVMMLNPESMKNEARSVALEVASSKQLFLAPEALPAVDILVDEHLPIIGRTWVDADHWKSHLRRVSSEVADTYVKEGTRRIDSATDLLGRVRAVLSCYPYD